MSMKVSASISKVFKGLLIIFLVLGVLPVSPALAASSGPNFPGTGSDVTGIGTVIWLNPGYIVADDALDATAHVGAGDISHYLQGTNFGFAIPADATIDGIQVTIAHFSLGRSAPLVQDTVVSLVKAGTITGDNKASTDYWPTTEATATYGSVTDLWGTTWTPAEINAGDFGVVLSVTNQNTNGSRTAHVDYMTITVTYSVHVLEVTALTDTYGNTVNLSATLSPAATDKSIAFTLNGAAACTGTTVASGMATCSTTLKTNVGTYATGVGASFAGDPTYPAISGTASLTVNARPLTVTAVADTKTYDGTTASSGVPTITSGDLVTGDTATWTQTFDTKDAGTGKTLTPAGTVNDGNGGANYTVTFAPDTTGVINPLAITVTADAKTKVYGTTDPALTYTVTPPLAGGDQFTGNLTRVAGEDVGPYAIQQGDLSAGNNYALTFVGADLTITKANQTITVTTHAPAWATNGSSFTVAATSDSGLAVSYSASGSCTNVGATFTMTSGLGTCLVQYDQAGDLNHNPAAQVVETVNAANAPVVILNPVDVYVNPGENATFTAGANGDPTPTVQWQVSTDGGLTFTDLAGETSLTLTLTTPPLSSNFYRYRAVFTNGGGSATTSAATLHLVYYFLYTPNLYR